MKRKGFVAFTRVAMLAFIVLTMLFSSCYYPEIDHSEWDISQKTKDSLSYLQKHHYTLNANFKVIADSLPLEQLPVKDVYRQVYKGDRIVVAEFMTQSSDSVDSLWVKVARDQNTQGWIRESELLTGVMPTDSISQFIHLFSSSHTLYFLAVFIVFSIYIFVRAILRKQVRLVYFNDIDSVFPMLLCVMVAISATFYGTLQTFVPDTWKHFYYNPSINPLRLPLLLGAFVVSVWSTIIIAVAVLDDLFRQLKFLTAIFYLLGLLTGCIICYLLFIFTTSFYVSYLLLAILIYLFIRRVRVTPGYKFRCGDCGTKLKEKGICPHCGAINT